MEEVVKLARLYFSLSYVVVPSVFAGGYIYYAVSKSIEQDAAPLGLAKAPVAPKASDIDGSVRNGRSARALTPEEVELIYGANSGTEPPTGGGCDASGCHTTAWLPPDPPPPPPLTTGGGSSGNGGSGGSSGGGGSSGDSAVSQDYKDAAEKCATYYGHLTPVYTTNFTVKVGWTAVDAAGVPIKHIVTDSIEDPTEPLPTGAVRWSIADASTFFDDSPPHTDIYGTAYYSFGNVIKVLTHEWYHQHHDVPGESLAQRNQNELDARAAGQAALDAFNNAPVPRPDCTQ
jgi:hypothetical protein